MPAHDLCHDHSFYCSWGGSLSRYANYPLTLLWLQCCASCRGAENEPQAIFREILIIKYMVRITSYNVCYTKLLRQKCTDPKLNDDWTYLQASDHFYYMCTKYFSDGDVHAYFNPYESPYQAFRITSYNVCYTKLLRCLRLVL